MIEEYYRVRSILAVFGLVMTAMLSSCSSSPDLKDQQDQKTILFAEFMHEVNSFSPVITTEVNFKADHLFYGDDVLASAVDGRQTACRFSVCS